MCIIKRLKHAPASGGGSAAANGSKGADKWLQARGTWLNRSEWLNRQRAAGGGGAHAPVEARPPPSPAQTESSVKSMGGPERV